MGLWGMLVRVRVGLGLGFRVFRLVNMVVLLVRVRVGLGLGLRGGV